MIELVVVIIEGYFCYQLHTESYPVFFSRITPYVGKITGDHQRGFRRNKSATGHVFCIRHTLEENWEFNGTVHQLFIDFEKTYDSVRRLV
jgi:hypothetical protein